MAARRCGSVSGNRQLVAMLLVLLPIGCCVPTARSAEARHRDAIGSPVALGKAPLCEASGAIHLANGVILAVDNEVDDALFAFRLHGGTLCTDPEHDVSLKAVAKDARPNDVESATVVADDVLLV